MRMRSIKWKLIIMYLGLVLIVMIVSGTYILLSLRNIEIDKSRQELATYAERINEQVIEGGKDEEFQEKLLKTVSNAVGIQGNILNTDGETIASTTVTEAPYPVYTDQAIIAAMNGMTSFSTQKKSTDSFGLLREWMSYATPVQTSGTTPSYIIYTRLDASDMQTSLDKTTQTIVAAVMIALFLAAVMGFVFAQTLTGPILALTTGAKNLAEGNMDQSLTVRSNDEIGQLTSSFNNMAAELSKNMSEISREKNRLEILLHNMSDGVISFSKDGELMLANAAAEGMLGLEKIEMNFTEFIRAYDISSSVYLDMGNEPSKKVIFPVGKQFINANFSPYYDKRGEVEGVVVVLQDITEQKKLDDMRKEFVANVSHELRTPLALMQAQLELFSAEHPDVLPETANFLFLLREQTERLTQMTKTLLEMSNLQQVARNEQIQLAPMVEEIFTDLAPLAEKRSITLEVDGDGVMTGSDALIYRLLFNLTENAVKYNRPNGSVRVSVLQKPEKLLIRVSDTGCGIPEEYQQSIFHPFFRVDKSRSREYGGAGLGLSLVWEIADLHNGSVWVDESSENGSTIAVEFLTQHTVKP